MLTPYRWRPHKTHLSPREQEILKLAAQGQRVSQIARTLWLSPHTVRNHLKNAYRVLHASDLAEALLRAIAPVARYPCHRLTALLDEERGNSERGPADQRALAWRGLFPVESLYPNARAFCRILPPLRSCKCEGNGPTPLDTSGVTGICFVMENFPPKFPHRLRFVCRGITVMPRPPSGSPR